MKYTHVLNYIAQTPWAIASDKMTEIMAVIAHRAAGHTFSAEEIQARIGEPAPAQPSKRGAVAVIPLRGVIAHRMGGMQESSGGMSTERFVGMLRAAVADEGVGTIVLDVDSPGGTVPGVLEAANELYAAREHKHIVAVANSTMASAAYWIASQAHEVVAIPSVLDRSIGSIGVFTVHQDLSAHLEKEGIKVTLIKAGKHKAEANPFEPLSDELRGAIQASVEAAYEQFVKAVARGRGVSIADVRGGYGEGRALNAADAKAAGLIDRIATMDDVIGRLVGRRQAAGMRAEDDAPALAAETDSTELTAEQAAAAAENELRGWSLRLR